MNLKDILYRLRGEVTFTMRGGITEDLKKKQKAEVFARGGFVLYEAKRTHLCRRACV